MCPIYVNFRKLTIKTNVSLYVMEVYYANPLFSDVIIEVESKIYHCHRILLAVASPYLKGMLQSSLEEGLKQKVKLEDISVASFEVFLKHVYGVQYELPSDLSSLATLIEEVHIFICPKLIEKLWATIMNKYSSESKNLEGHLSIFQLGYTYDMPLRHFNISHEPTLILFLKSLPSSQMNYFITVSTIPIWKCVMYWLALHQEEKLSSELIDKIAFPAIPYQRIENLKTYLALPNIENVLAALARLYLSSNVVWRKTYTQSLLSVKEVEYIAECGVSESEPPVEEVAEIDETTTDDEVCDKLREEDEIVEEDEVAEE